MFKLEAIRDFITGGDEFAQKRARLSELNEELEKRGHLSRNKGRERAVLDLAIGRRLLFTRGITIAGTALGVGGLGLANLGRIGQVVEAMAGHSNSASALAGVENRNIVDTRINLEANRIRHQIREFEAAHGDRPVTTETVKQLLGFTQSLYHETFGKPVLPPVLEVWGNDNWKKWGLNDVTWPVVDSYYLLSNLETGYRVRVILGKPETFDPKVKQIEVYRAAVMRAFMHTQTRPQPEQREVVFIGGERFTAVVRKGLKWTVIINGQPQDRGSGFENMNNQLLAEYMNDPTNQDTVFQRASESPVYKYSVPSIDVQAAAILRGLYRSLGIIEEEVEYFHYKANPEGLLTRIDTLMRNSSAARLRVPPSHTLIALNFSEDSIPDRDLQPLKLLASRVATVY